jgi:voltage-gated potassium channel
LLRIFKLHVSVREYASQGQAFIERNRIQELGSVILLTIFTGALGFFYAEQGVNPNLHSFRDSVWWAMVTVTTIGYGDIYPVTTAGRLIAVALMIIGIGTVSLFTGLIAAGVLRENTCPHCGEKV